MITQRPGFFADWRRFDLATAFRKRWGQFSVAGQTYKYDQIVKLDWNAACALLAMASQYRNAPCICWAFESLSIQARGNILQVWPALMAAVAGHHDDAAGAVLEDLFDKYAIKADALKTVQLDARGNFLIGKVYSDLAFKAKGSNKSSLQQNKKNALHFLGQARQQVQTAQPYNPQVDPYRQAAIAAALAASIAAAYEAAAYLQWKGTRTAALAE